ncbi:hypothetical protein AOLI_G00045940 [Acnodon oligacanthus]
MLLAGKQLLFQAVSCSWRNTHHSGHHVNLCWLRTVEIRSLDCQIVAVAMAMVKVARAYRMQDNAGKERGGSSHWAK